MKSWDHHSALHHHAFFAIVDEQIIGFPRVQKVWLVDEDLFLFSSQNGRCKACSILHSVKSHINGSYFAVLGLGSIGRLHVLTYSALNYAPWRLALILDVSNQGHLCKCAFLPCSQTW